MMQLFRGNLRVCSVGFSPDGQHVVSGSDDGTIRVIDRRTGDTVVGPVHGHSDTVNSVEFSPNGMQIVSGSDDKSVRVWDAQTGQQVAVCGEYGVSHDSGVTSVGFSPNGLCIVSAGSYDNTVCVWDAQTGKMLLGPLRRHADWVRCVQFSPDSSHIVSCSSDGTIRFWDVSSCATKSQTQEEAGGESQTAHPGQDLTKALDSWTLDDEGWAVDSENRRLVWVPSDLRVPLPIPPNDLTISDQGGMRLDFDGAMKGETWTGCFRV
ncbi:WD40 repeat-like protein [Rhizoctonia solani]|uniref:WD40 repeat-like protein n=1 Tax=Rhizoctonia solani TaxID=456999 RepID=A0A8H7LKN8_9AGAM|nr:WD40 repeat-like protein [Rhizoctonia solani]